MAKYRVYYTTHKYSDCSDIGRASSRIIKADSPEDARQVLRDMRDNGGQFGARYVGGVSDLVDDTAEDDTIPAILRLCERLNKDAYKLQSVNYTKRVKCFVPCAKADVLIQHCNKPFMVGATLAALELCPCHNGLDATGMIELAYSE